MNDESDYDHESEADTGPMLIPVDEHDEQPVRLQVMMGAAAQGESGAGAAAGAPSRTEAVVTVPGGVINIAGKALRGPWSVIKPGGDGSSR